MLIYGLRCSCHGVRLYETPLQRDAAAITYQCRQEWFRVQTESESKSAVS